MPVKPSMRLKICMVVPSLVTTVRDLSSNKLVANGIGEAVVDHLVTDIGLDLLTEVEITVAMIGEMLVEISVTTVAKRVTGKYSSL